MTGAIRSRGAGRKRLQAQRAMASLAWGLGLFVAMQLGLQLLIARRLPEFRDPPYWTKHHALQRRLESAPVPPVTVVMLGSSRTAFGLDGQLLEGELGRALGRPAVVFNLGVYGSGPVSQRVFLRRLLADGVRPDLLLVEVLPALLHDEEPPEEVHRLPAERLQWEDLPVVRRYAGAVGEPLWLDWWVNAAAPLCAHRLAILSGVASFLLPSNIRAEWWGTMNASGWVRLPDTTSAGTLAHRLEQARAEWAPKLARLRPGGPAGQALREMLAELRHRGIPAALVLMPEGPAMRSWYPAAAWGQTRAYVEGLSREYGCPLVNAREWVGEEGFSDSHHLLAAGARVFSERLGREAILPALRPR